MSALIDAGARERIENDLDVSMCVEAGAGTGKTTMLVRRIVALLRTGRATIEQLAVITFTEKAAAELSARLRFALEVAADDAVDEHERVRLETALLGLYRARVQTIHAFAGDLLRERPVEAGIDPQFGVLEELASSLDFDAVYRAWLDDLLASSREEIEVAMRRGLELRQLRQVAEIVHQHRDVLPLVPLTPAAPDVAGYRAWAAGARQVLEECEPTCVDHNDNAYPWVAQVVDFLTLVQRADAAELERLVLFEAPWPGLGGAKGNWSPPENCGRVKDIYREVRDRTPALRDVLRTDALVRVLPHVERFVKDYTEQRRLDGVADFDDLLIRARDLVRDNRLVRDHFHRRTTHVLVDEFQDTDPIQAELVSWITAPPGASGDWRTVVPEPGRLFVVGDPKQSIYRFRGADIAAYDTVKNGPLAGRLERLEQNFRSTRSVLKWINDVFDHVFVERAGVQPANTHLHARATSLDDELERSSIVVVHSLGDWAASNDSAEAMRKEESSLLARTLWRAVERERWPVRDRRADDAVRPAQWRDIAVLLPARTRVELLEAALQNHGVPYRLEGGRGFYSRQEVRDLISLLEAIDDPGDSIAIVAALRSLAFGCSDEELLLWRATNSRFDYRRPGTDGPASVRQSLEVIGELHRAQRSLSLGELVRRAVDEAGLVEAALTVPGGDQAAANILKVVDIAQAFAGAGGGALRGFTNWLARNRDEEEHEVDAPVAEERDDVVRVMTVHAAKGLEFPIVALGNVEWRGSNQVPPVADPATHRVHFTVGNEWARFSTPDWETYKESEKGALEAEKARLLYVATTRARDHLVIPVCNRPEKAKGFMAMMYASVGAPDEARWGHGVADYWQFDTRTLADVPEHPPELVAVDPGAAPSESALEQRAQVLAQRDEVVRRASRGVELVTASSVKSRARPLVAEADADSRGEAPAAIDTADAPPLELGDAFHRVMELVDLPAGETLTPLTEAICQEHGIPESAEAVVAMARLTISALTRERVPVDGSCREVPFVVPDGDRVLIGRVDLVAQGAEGVDVVDFKTDTRSAEPVAAAVLRHQGQLETYEQAASSVLGRDGLAVRVVFAKTGELAGLSG